VNAWWSFTSEGDGGGFLAGMASSLSSSFLVSETARYSKDFDDFLKNLDAATVTARCRVLFHAEALLSGVTKNHWVDSGSESRLTMRGLDAADVYTKKIKYNFFFISE